MMTRKDYDRIAEVLGRRLKEAKDGCSPDVFLTLCTIQSDLSDLFLDNINFDVQRFCKLILDKVYP